MADPLYQGPKSAQESRQMWDNYRSDYMKAYPNATYQDALKSFQFAIESKSGVRDMSGFETAPTNPDTAYGKLTSLHKAASEGVQQSVAELTGSPTVGAVAGSLVPQSPVETGAAIGAGAVGKIAQAARPSLRPALRILGGVGGATIAGPPDRPISENFVNALPVGSGQAMAEATRLGGTVLRNMYKTRVPSGVNAYTANQFLSGLEEDIGVPVLRNRLMANAGEKSAETIAQGPAGRIREVFGQVMQDAEDRIRSLLPSGGSTQLGMPSLATQAQQPMPGHPSLLRTVTKYPSFDEALELVKRAKSDARIAQARAANQQELMQAAQMVERADKLESEFHNAITGLAGKNALSGYAKAQGQFAKAMRLQSLTDDPSIFIEGAHGLEISQPGLRAAMLKNIKDFPPDMFPNTYRAVSGGQVFGAEQPIKVPGISIQPDVAGTRQYLGGFNILTRYPGGSNMGPGAIQSSLLGLTGGEISREWRNRGDRGSLLTPVQ